MKLICICYIAGSLFFLLGSVLMYIRAWVLKG